MPELPEVETIVRQLNKKVRGKTIKSINNLDSKVVDPKILRILPVKIINIKRRGKLIIIELSNNQFLLTHLRMTGHFQYFLKNNFLNDQKFVVAKFNFDDGSSLTHNSIRKFGGIKLLDKEKLDLEISKLGVEPLGVAFTLKKFNELLLKKSKSNIKTILLNQSLIAGIGNIYAQEALYFVGINPQKKASELSLLKIKQLHAEIIRMLKFAIQKKGSTVNNYTNMGGAGGYQNYLAIYNKKECPKKHKLEKINLGGRGTYFCPVCQR
jgi:formamidopyrimidine-DNA glycosylase